LRSYFFNCINNMSFQAYLDNIKTKTGLGPDEFKTLAEKKGFYNDGAIPSNIKAGDIVKWLKEDFQLGHGHSMAIYALLKGIKD
jgi:hypothetical protein